MERVKGNQTNPAEATIADVAKVERNRRWRDENRAGIAAYAEEVAQDGLPLAAFCTFEIVSRSSASTR